MEISNQVRLVEKVENEILEKVDIFSLVGGSLRIYHILRSNFKSTKNF